ncbi:GNAT family N-acetyltransferase [Halobacterium sp. CBA1126]|uniref:GNAT family N-acetyltransferase n=1 Tax=Halobacterium sp. CBA1126 TaxID=2668074 RepID=UPI0012F9EB2F|nr:GNAT family protein [Halobacterium sp. CBA1126]MUV60087.1 GNAT family N-acetyltransferase [Halobacterium sp. CBA1126]
MPGPVLEVGDDLVLRTVERDDAAFLQRLFTDPYARLGLHATTHKSEAEVETFVEEDVEDESNAAYLACVDEEDAPYDHPDDGETTPVAFVFARHVDRDRPGLVLWVPEEHRGEGYGAAAVELALRGVFRTYDAHSVGATVLESDEHSQSAFEAAGFTDEGRGREVWFAEGEYQDAVEYGLLREEWEA